MQLQFMYMTRTAVLAGAAVILMLMDFPIVFMPGFLKMDLSEIPAIIGAFSMGPLAGLWVMLLKNLLHLTNSQTAGIGELANFLVGSAFVLTAGFIYRRYKSRQGAITALLSGTIAMTVAAAALNYWVLIPLYQAVLNFPGEAVVNMGHAVNPFIINLKTFILFAIIPFNLLKGLLVSLITILIYKKLSHLLH
ncbi:riboflavin transporter FmnP [Anaerospora hongkongensis]|uniref:Riboflavin transporter n=1 Tax=Anaerospora hongkongensis TaxID=244830 RepID=A0A4V2Q8I5_9FIRM|nr:ECF transporter S component [Anaerospora hongkongensis]TCL36850.1 riboflavin transporter FmnP [Anaerospora hongkongensis]